MDLKSYIGRRLLILIPTALGAVLILFFLFQFLTPYQMAASFAKSPAEAANIEQIIARHNLDAEFHVQFYQWFTELLRGNLGYSQTYGGPVTEAFVHYAPITLELFIFAVPLTIWASIKMGVFSAVNQDESGDHAVRITSILGRAMPNFWLGLLLVWIGYAVLGWFGIGRLPTQVDAYVASEAFTQYTRINTIDAILNLDLNVFLQTIRHLVLPVTTLVVSSWALITRITRSSMLDVLGRGYITTARSKGLSEDVVINKHAKRNALIPVLTVSGYLVISMLLGAFIVETIFAWHGLGWFFARAAVNNDYAAVIGFTLIFTIIVLLVNLIVDILYAKMDPRVRLG